MAGATTVTQQKTRSSAPDAKRPVTTNTRQASPTAFHAAGNLQLQGMLSGGLHHGNLNGDNPDDPLQQQALERSVRPGPLRDHGITSLEQNNRQSANSPRRSPSHSSFGSNLVSTRTEHGNAVTPVQTKCATCVAEEASTEEQPVQLWDCTDLTEPTCVQSKQAMAEPPMQRAAETEDEQRETEPVQSKCAACKAEDTMVEEQPVQAKCATCEAEGAAAEEEPVQSKCAGCDAEEAGADQEAEQEPVQLWDCTDLTEPTCMQTKCTDCQDEEPVQQGRTKAPVRSANLIHREAKHGLSNASSPLPHADRIQASFGHHDVSHVRSSVGGSAETANQRIGALAFTSGHRIAFRQSPDLHLAAHEAAHVVQQREGLSLPGNVGRAGDRWEQHADKVADAVTGGRSAETLLDEVSIPTAGSAERLPLRHLLLLQKQDESPAAADPQVESLRQLLSDGDETGALAAMVLLTSGQVSQVLSDASLHELAVSTFNDEEMVVAIRNMGGLAVPSLRWLFAEGVDFADFRDWLSPGPNGVGEVLSSDEMRDGFVSVCDDEQMAEALGMLPGNLERKLNWLQEEGAGYSEAASVIRMAPEVQRTAIYDDLTLRDWFVDVCDDILMQNLVMLLGGRLIQKLQWMQAEGSSWALMLVVIGDRRVTAAERAEVLDDLTMRRFFQETLDDDEMTLALETLGGTLSQKMEWLAEEGALSVPVEAQHLPEITPRDAALMDSLDRATPLFTLFERAEAARETVRMQRGARGDADDPSAVADAMQVSEERLQQAEEALGTELRRLGYADEAAFRDELRRFETFFQGFALQTAFTMLAENRHTAEAQLDRYTGTGGTALVGLLRDALLQDVPTMVAIRTSWSEITPGSLRGAMAEHPILANPAFFTGGMLDMLAANDVTGVAAHARTIVESVIAKIDEVRTSLSGDSSKLWQMQPVIARAKEALGIVQGSAMDGILRRKLAQVSSDEAFTNLVLAALAIGLGLLSGGTGTVAVLAGAGALGLSAWQANEHWQEFAFQQAAHGSAIDPAQALVEVPASAVWLALDIAGVFLDAHGLTTAMRTLGPSATAVRTARNATEAAARAQALEQAAAQAIADGAVRSTVRSERALTEAVRDAAEREVARRATLESTPDLARRIRELNPRLAEDTAAQAGLVRMGGAAAGAAIDAFRDEPVLLQRLGRLCEMDPAAAAGAHRLRATIGDDVAFAAILRDGLMRRDPARARSLLAMAGDGHLSEEAMRRLATAGMEADSIARATSVAEVAEREAAAATGTALPGSRSVREALDETRALDATAITDPVTQLHREWEVVQSSRPLPIRDGDYVAEVALPNGHRWRQNRRGGWCRFSDEFCLTDAATAALNAASASPLERAVANAGEFVERHESLVRNWESIRDRLRPTPGSGSSRLRIEQLSASEREALEELIDRGGFNADIEDLTLRDVASLFERRVVIDRRTGRRIVEPSQADLLLERARTIEDAAIESLRDSTRPLYDKLRSATPSARVRSAVLRRAGGQDQFLRARPPSGALDVDHIVPLAEIMDMPGFRSLDWSDQVAIANAMENLRAIDRSANRSRQALSWGDEWAGRAIYTPEALQLARQTEEQARQSIQEMINLAQRRTPLRAR